MRVFPIVVSLCVAIVTGSTIVAKCRPRPAYVYDGVVLSCRRVTVQDVKKDPIWIDLEAVKTSLETHPVSIVTLRASRSVQVSRCEWEQDCEPEVRQWNEVAPREFRFHMDGDCRASFLDSKQPRRFYVVQPCCDLFPSKSSRCALGLPVILDPPAWAVDIVNRR